MTAPRWALPILLTAIGGLLALLGACNDAPTVPIPPPEICVISPPDADGMCTVGCEGGNTARNVALVYNDSWGMGVMQETEEDGSFETLIEAEVGDVLLIQIKQDRQLSAEEAMAVPAE
jgi:hypothetical protein